MLLKNIILPQPANQHCKTTTEIAKMFSPVTNITFKVLAVVSMNALDLYFGRWVPTLWWNLVNTHKHYSGMWSVCQHYGGTLLIGTNIMVVTWLIRTNFIKDAG